MNRISKNWVFLPAQLGFLKLDALYLVRREGSTKLTCFFAFDRYEVRVSLDFEDERELEQFLQDLRDRFALENRFKGGMR